MNLAGGAVDGLAGKLEYMNGVLAHRGPDDCGRWQANDRSLGFAHRRLSIIDLSEHARQPMTSEAGTVVCFNGEIYNYLELRNKLSEGFVFRTQSDTETILAAYERYGLSVAEHLRGMFAFLIWDPGRRRLVCARDRFGIKPLYYAQVGDALYLASEAKALLAFLPSIETDTTALAEYMTFQYSLGEETLFKGVKRLQPGHLLVAENGQVTTSRYWDVRYEIDWDHNASWFHRRLEQLLDDSIGLHLRADVPIGSYLSGGIDSSLIAILASRQSEKHSEAFHGKFTCHPGYDESEHARSASRFAGKTLHETEIAATDFIDEIEKVIWHLDYPVAGPGSFPQYMVSKLASQHVKVVLGGQGGDEIFGGYARYLLAYFEQCLKAAIDGTHRSGNFVVTPESIIPNLGVLKEYKPLIKTFFGKGLFESLDLRYFRLIDRSADMADEVRWELLDTERVWDTFDSIFNSRRNVGHEAYFDSMTHFDFKTLLPALLHVEDRMSMAHGLESRVPLLDHPLVEFAATVPADVKFKDGHMKHMLKETYADLLPRSLLERRDKMGFPVPLSEWYQNELRSLIGELFSDSAARSRPYMNSEAVLANFGRGGRFSRKTWGLMSLEIWHRLYEDRAPQLRREAVRSMEKFGELEKA